MWKMFCWGLLAGWLIEWIIDWLFWRKNSGVSHSTAVTGMTGAALASGMGQSANTGNASASLASGVSSTGASILGTVGAAGAAGFAGAAIPGVMSYKQDDLEAIEGVGPKIAELLKNNGVVNFSQLAASPVEHLTKILDAGGSRFKLANPSTWAEQAALAAKGDWVAFEKLKEELTAGVRMAKDDQ